MGTDTTRLAEHALLAPRLYAALNERSLVAAEALFAPDATILDIASGQRFTGPGAVARYLAGWYSAFDPSNLEVLGVRGSDEGATVELLFTGRHVAALETVAGRIGATGSEVELRRCDVMDIDHGRIEAMRTYYDEATLLSQLGLAQEPAPTEVA